MLSKEIKIPQFLVSLLIGGLVLAFQPENGPPAEAWRLLSVFVMTIVGILLQAMPMGMMAILGLCLSVFINALSLKLAIAGFGNPVIWLIVVAYFIAQGFSVTGLGYRLAYRFISWLGRSPLGLAYGIVASEVILAPAIPSNTARSGGVILPVVRSLGETFGSTPEEGTSRKISSYLIVILTHANLLTSTLFLTGMVGNPFMVSIASDYQIDVTWLRWFLVASVPGLLSLVVLPLVVYLIYPPELKETHAARDFARKKLHDMGKISLGEWKMLGVFFLILVLWMAGSQIGVHPTATAVLGLVILLLTGVLKWNEITSLKSAWDTFLWFSVLLMMAGNLNELGFTKWVSDVVGSQMGGVHWHYAVPVLLVSYFFSHYLFASTTAHMMAMAPAFVGIGVALGAPSELMIFAIGFLANLVGCLTHYASGPSAVIFGAGFVSVKDWCRVGPILGVYHFLLWSGVCAIWWKYLGIW